MKNRNLNGLGQVVGWRRALLLMMPLVAIQILSCDKDKFSPGTWFVLADTADEFLAERDELCVDVFSNFQDASVPEIEVTIDANPGFLETIVSDDVESLDTETQELQLVNGDNPFRYVFTPLAPDRTGVHDGAEFVQRVTFEVAAIDEPQDVTVTWNFAGHHTESQTFTLRPRVGDPCEGVIDALEDWVDSILGVTVPFPSPWFDIICSFGRVEPRTQEQVDTDYNESTYECGTHDGSMRVVCPASVSDMPEGDVVLISAQHAADIPDADTDHSYIYSVVFDSDGDPANDWVPIDPWNGDYFQGADRWYQCIWDHTTSTWSVTVTQVDSSMGTMPVISTARCVIEGDTVTWHISKSELPATPLGYRVTAFGHDGLFSASDRGGDVSGADATEPLTDI